MRFRIGLILAMIVFGSAFGHKALALTGVTLTVDNDAHQLVIDNYVAGKFFPETATIQYNDTSKDIQGMRLQRDDVTYVLGLVWDQNVLTLNLYDDAGEKIGQRDVFKANHDKGKDFNVMRLEAVTVNGEALIQVRAIKLTYAQPTSLERKRFDVKPSADRPLPLANIYSKTIAYPDLSGLDNETAGGALFNYERMAAGLLTVKRNSDLDDGCAKHDEYMRLNDELTHSEEETKPGYTTEGAAAGLNSDLAERSTTDMTSAILLWTTAIYHRMPMLGNGMRTFGWDVTDTTSASGVHYTCLNVYGGADVYNISGSNDDTTYYEIENYEPIPYPGVNQGHIPTTFSSGENPDPIAAFGGTYPVGQPVSLIFSDNDTVTAMSMTLTNEVGASITGYFRAPDDPTDPNSDYQNNAVTFIPEVPLSAKTTYTVTVSGQRNDKSYSKEWQFRTE